MRSLRISLFGKFNATWNGQTLSGLDGLKAQELLAYLILHKNTPIFREKIAHQLWPDSQTTAQAKNYLRKALWNIQSAFQVETELKTLIYANAEWIEFSIPSWVFIDVLELERVYKMVEEINGEALEQSKTDKLESIQTLYCGELLEGRYFDWCLLDRERYELMFLVIMDKLMHFYEAQNLYEKACLFGLKILQFDPARERTHRQLIRLFVKADMRVEAHRQYKRCVKILRKELQIEPSLQTKQLLSLEQKEPPLKIPTQFEKIQDLRAYQIDQCLLTIEQSIKKLKQQIKI